MDYILRSLDIIIQKLLRTRSPYVSLPPANIVIILIHAAHGRKKKIKKKIKKTVEKKKKKKKADE